ncbi:hypothetical protein ABPG75_006951 [Micractinium tetrahymenae]
MLRLCARQIALGLSGCLHAPASKLPPTAPLLNGGLPRFGETFRGFHPSIMLPAAAGSHGGDGGTESSSGLERERQLAAEGAEIDASSHRHAPALFLGWSAIAGVTAAAAVGRGVPAELALLVDTTFWLAVVSSISLTEAWVKFRAPLLERWVGVDVGRRVFRAQYALEAALAATACGLVYWQAGSAQAALQLLASPPGALLAAAGALFLAEAGLVFPALDARGRHLIASSAWPETLSTQRQAAYVAAVRASVAGRTPPPAPLHLASVLLAFARAGLLAGCTWGLLLQHAVEG